MSTSSLALMPLLLAVLAVLAGCEQRAHATSAAASASARPVASVTASAVARPAASAAPSAVGTPADGAKRGHVFANLDPQDDAVVGPPQPIPDCEARLAQAGVTFRVKELPVRSIGDRECGAPQVVSYLRGPGKIAFEPTPLLGCGMALALAAFEPILQAEAERLFHSPVVRVAQLGTYSCREIAAYKGVVSEHSYANAIDLSRFRLKNGTLISVLGDFDLGAAPPAKPAGAFLRAVSRRSFDEGVFSNVLTPFWDAHHKDHFHLDLARYRVDGVR